MTCNACVMSSIQTLHEVLLRNKFLETKLHQVLGYKMWLTT